MQLFNGFPKEMIAFFDQLEINNNREWFLENKHQYEQNVKKPAAEFVLAVGENLKQFSPEIQAIPKVNKSLFRINRDVRFSKDKRPYKTNLGIWFWLGEQKRMECPGYYFQYENHKIMLGAGLYAFTKNQLSQYRQGVVDDKLAPKLTKVVQSLKNQGFQIGVQHYKKIPRGFDANHTNSKLLLHNGLTAWSEYELSDDFYSPEIADFSGDKFKQMKPINDWLISLSN